MVEWSKKLVSNGYLEALDVLQNNQIEARQSVGSHLMTPCNKKMERGWAPCTRGRSTRRRSLTRGPNDKRARSGGTIRSLHGTIRDDEEEHPPTQGKVGYIPGNVESMRRWCDEHDEKTRESTLASSSSDPTKVPAPGDVVRGTGVEFCG